ncbi:hypothetical protein C8F01DRAFT_1181334 [Mycena amicta]|nr:hypothetical protein C8F01DRAFT_1181334 [Mycena amicta]
MASNPQPRETDPLLPHTPRISEDSGSESEAVAAPVRKPAFLWLVPVILIASICKGISMYAQFEHYQNEFCPSGSRNPPCGYYRSYFHLPGFTIYTQFTTTFAGFVVSFVSVGWWSQLGDRRGRKMLLLFPIVGTAILDMLFYIVATAGPLLTEDDQRDVLSIGFIVQGLLGGWATFGGAIHAYAFDVAENPSHRLTLFGIIEALFLVGTIAGGAIGTATHSFKYAYLLSILLALAYLGVVYTLLPESKQPSTHSTNTVTDQSSHSLVASVFLPFTTFFPKGGKALPLLGLASYVYSLTSALDTNMLQYTEEYAYQKAFMSARTVFLWVVYLLPRIFTLLSLLVVIPYFVRRYSKTSPSPPADPITLPLSFTHNSLLGLISLPLVVTLFCGLDYGNTGISTGAPVLYALSTLLIPFFSRLPGVGIYALAAAYAERVGRSSEVGQLFGALALWAELGTAISYASYGPGLGVFSETYLWSLVALVCLMPDPPQPVVENIYTGDEPTVGEETRNAGSVGAGDADNA